MSEIRILSFHGMAIHKLLWSVIEEFKWMPFNKSLRSHDRFYIHQIYSNIQETSLVWGHKPFIIPNIGTKIHTIMHIK